jgi:carboxypeptidase family protein/TonB-dependent receptor-like protein
MEQRGIGLSSAPLIRVASSTWIVCLALALIAPAVLLAQSFTASVRGEVTDASQSPVPAAKITVTDVNRNLEHTAHTDVLGRYVITALPPSSYTLTVEAAGFQKFLHSAFRLDVQQQATIDAELGVGQIATSVEVEAAAPLLNSTSAALGQVIQNRYITELPLIARNPYTLSYLTPGIVGSAGSYGSGDTNFVAVGTRNSTADVMLDGVSVTGSEPNAGITSVLHTPSVEAVEEFKVQTSFFSAEFGNSGGAIINMVTKSGTNQFHGDGYWFHRGSSLNANSFFANRAGSPRPLTHRNLVGGTFGGPVKRNKTFFFAAYERTADASPTSRTASFPTLQQRTGDFSDWLTASGQQITIYNPFNLVTNSAGNIARTPFPGNIIPKSMLDPVAVNVTTYYPAPNLPGQPFTHVNNWFFQGVDVSAETKMEMKLDHNFSDKNRVSMRWSPRWYLGNQANNLGPGKPGDPWSAKHSTIGGQKSMFDFTRAHNPSTVFSVRFGLVLNHYYSVPLVPFDLTTLGLPKVMLDNATTKEFPIFTTGNYMDIGDTGFVVQSQEQGHSQIIASMTKIIGGHNLKVGGEFKWNFLDYSLPGYPSGSFSFSQQITSQDRFASSPTQGNGFASMLLGWGSGSRYDIVPWVQDRNEYWAFYVQDDWKISRKLTVNLGLRYDLDRARWEKQNRFSYWDLSDPSPLNGKVPGLGPLYGYMKFVDDNHASPYPTPKTNFQPRVGIAYALNDKTTLRTGYGLFYTLSRASVTGSIGTGFSAQPVVTWSNDSNLTRYATLSNPYPDGMLLPPGRSQGAMTFIGLGANTVLPENIKPSYHSWNFSIQRQLPGSSVIEINYTGTHGEHLFVPIASLQLLNPQYWSLGRNALTALVPNPFYGVITDPRSTLSLPTVAYNRLLRAYPQYSSASRDTGMAGGNTSYNALQIRYEKRFAHGLSMLAHYTISKMLDNCGDGTSNYDFLGGGTALQNFFNLKNERGLSASDIPRRLVVTFSYQLPVGKGRALGTNWGRVPNALLGGWSVSSFITMQAGPPIFVTQSGGTLWDATQRPNLVGDPSMPGSAADRIYRYFNTAAFKQPATDTYGSAPRELNYRAPGIRTADMAVLKNFAVTERMHGEFRLEMQNFANHPVFGTPNASFGSSSFGIISGYVSGIGPRTLQLGTKFLF